MNKQLESGIVDIEKNRLYILEIKTIKYQGPKETGNWK